MDVVLRGATGRLGATLLARAERRDDLADVRWLLAGAEPARVRNASDRHAGALDVALAAGPDATPPIGGLVVDLADPTASAVQRARDAARAGAGYLGTGRAVAAWRRAAEDWGSELEVAVVPSLAYDAAIADLLVDLLVGRCPAELHVAHLGDGPLRSWSTGTPGHRRSLLVALAGPVLALEHGHLVERRTAEDRRLAWFPRPMGPRHTAAVPALEVLTTHLRVRDQSPPIQRMGSYLALSTAASEVVQAAGPWLARRAAGRLEGSAPRMVRGRRPAVGPGREAAHRWAVVVEAIGPTTARDNPADVARAWAYGSDPYGLTASLILDAIALAARGRLGTGILGAADLAAAGDWLDRRADDGDVRWRLPEPTRQPWRA